MPNLLSDKTNNMTVIVVEWVSNSTVAQFETLWIASKQDDGSTTKSVEIILIPMGPQRLLNQQPFVVTIFWIKFNPTI